MASSNLHALSNNYEDVRLVSLKSWKRANEISPRDSSGPYTVMQEGYDPQDAKSERDEFLLGKSGEWVSVGVFYKLPTELRRQEFIFGTAAEVIGLLETLTGNAKIYRKGTVLEEPEPGVTDDLNQAFQQSKGDTDLPKA
jgi:hypothetical protein